MRATRIGVKRPVLLSRLAHAVRFDGLWWRKLAGRGSANGPEWLKRRAPPLIAALIFALVGRRRRGATQNLQRVLDTDRGTARRAALRMYVEFAFCTSEAMEHEARRPSPLHLDRPAHDPVASALDEGRGVVVLTAHLGGWNVAASALAGLGRPVNVVRAREANETVQELTRAGHERAGMRVIFSDESVFSSIALIRALRRNEIVAMQIDRMSGAAGARLLPFLGAPAPFPAGPFVLARLAGVPVIPVFVARVGTRRYRMEFGKGITIPRHVRDPQAQDRAMLEIVGQLEDVVRRHPTQWFQFEPYWPDLRGEHRATPIPAVRPRAFGRQPAGPRGKRRRKTGSTRVPE